MKRLLSRTLALPALLAVMFALAACNKSKDVEQPVPAKGSGKPSPVHQIMVKLAKGSQSLTSIIGDELESDPPEWDKIQPQTKEYTELVQSLAKYDPPRGSKESWAKLTGAFADSALALEKAAQAKDKDGALNAHKTISDSCTACHQQHRIGMGGMGGFGPPGKGFGPPGKDGGFPPPGKGFGPPPGKEGGEPPAKAPDNPPSP